MSDTIKIGRKPNIITIKRSEWHHEMFTTAGNLRFPARIGRILKKLLDPDQPCSEKELIDLMHWEGGNHSYYCIMTAIERGELV